MAEVVVRASNYILFVRRMNLLWCNSASERFTKVSIVENLSNNYHRSPVSYFIGYILKSDWCSQGVKAYVKNKSGVSPRFHKKLYVWQMKVVKMFKSRCFGL
jgi:hypothetical protein